MFHMKKAWFFLLVCFWIFPVFPEDEIEWTSKDIDEEFLVVHCYHPCSHPESANVVRLSSPFTQFSVALSCKDRVYTTSVPILGEGHVESVNFEFSYDGSKKSMRCAVADRKVVIKKTVIVPVRPLENNTRVVDRRIKP